MLEGSARVSLEAVMVNSNCQLVSFSAAQTHLGRARSKSVDRRMARKRRAESAVSTERSRSRSKAPQPRDKSGVRDDTVSVMLRYIN